MRQSTQIVIVGVVTCVVLGVPATLSQVASNMQGGPRFPTDWRYVTVVVVAGLLLAGGLVTLIVQRSRERRLALEQGETLRGWIVQANTALFEDGPASAPAQLLISFAGDRAASDEQLAELAKKAMRLKTAPPFGAFERQVASLVIDERYRRSVRHRLPLAFTDGVDVMSVHVWIERELLPERRLTLPYVRCMAVPGDAGPVFMVPDAPPESVRSGPPA